MREPVLFPCKWRQGFLKVINCPILLCNKSARNEKQNNRNAALIDVSNTKVVSLMTEPEREGGRLID